MTQNLIAIDPSLTCTGWAWFGNGALLTAGWISTSPEMGSPLVRAHHIALNIGESTSVGADFVFEAPQIYQTSRGAGDPNKIALGWLVIGAIGECGWVKRSETVFPAKWKGQVPKPVMFERIKRRLTDHEIGCCKDLDILKGPEAKCPGASSKAGNAMDAIGVGLWKLGRLG